MTEAKKKEPSWIPAIGVGWLVAAIVYAAAANGVLAFLVGIAAVVGARLVMQRVA